MTSVLPILGLLFVGWVVAKRHILAPADLAVLGRFVVGISLPALLFGAVGRLSETGPEGFSGPYFKAYGLASVATFALMYGLGLALKQRAVGRSSSARPSAPIAYAAVASAGPNSAFVTFPILALSLPSVADQVLVMNLVFENVVLLPLFLVALEMSERRGLGWRSGAVQAVHRLGKSPLIWAIVAGATPITLTASLNQFGLSVAMAWPQPLLTAADLLGRASVGIALVCIGGNLAQSRLGWDELREVVLPVMGKLLVHPALVGLMVWIVWPLEPTLAKAAFIAALAPTFSVFPMFALRHGAEVWASQVLLVSTLSSLALIAMTLSVFGL